MSADEFDFESAFPTPSENLQAPRLSVGVKDEERKIVQPQERLAAWLARGYGVLAFTTVLLLALIGSNTVVWTLSLVPCSILLIAFVPFLGKRPLASPSLLASAMLLLAIAGGFTSGIVQGVVDSRFRPFTGSRFFYHLAEQCQLYLEQVASIDVALSVTLLGVLLYGLGRWLLKKYPWVDSRLRVRSFHRYASLLLLVTLGALLVLPPLYVKWKVSNLEWPASVPPSVNSSVTRSLKSGGVTFPTLQQAQDESPRTHRRLLLDMTDEDFLAELGEMNSRLQDADYEVTEADFNLFHRVFERILQLKSASPNALRFLLLIKKVTLRFDLAMNTVDFDPALFRQSQLLVEIDDLEQLDQWSKLIEGIKVRTYIQEDVDRVALSLLNTPSLRGGRESETHSLTLFGVACGPSFTDILDEFERGIILLDYSVRRDNPFDEGEHPYRRMHRGTPTTLWPEKELDRFYSGLYRHTEEKADQQDPRLVKTLINLRKHKLEHGIYPEEVPAELRDYYSYTSLGEQAVLESTAAPQSIMYYKWVLR